MIVQEPVQAAIWHALNHYSFSDAIFLAERLYAEVASDDALYLLATCYYRAGKTSCAYTVLHGKASRTSQCRFLLARCCVDLNKYSEAELALTGSSIGKTKGLEDIINEFGDSASFAVQLLGQICSKTERFTKAAESYRKSLKLNPFIWSSYESLVKLGERPDPTKIFTIANLENFNMCQGSNALLNLVNKTSAFGDSVVPEVQQDVPPMSKVSVIPVSSAPSSLSVQSPLAIIRPNSDYTPNDVYTPENNNWGPISASVTKNTSNKLSGRNARGIFSNINAVSPLSPSFGVLPLDTPSPAINNNANIVNSINSALTYITPPALIDTQTIDSWAPNKKSVTRRGQAMTSSNPPKFQIFSQSGNNNNTTSQNLAPVSTPQSSFVNLPTSGLSSVRRSTRLFSSSNSVKENNKSSSKTGRFVSPKAPTKKTKTRNTKGTTPQPKEDLHDINKPDIQSENRIPNAPLVSVEKTAITIQKASAEGLMELLQNMGWAQLYLGHYCCRRAIDVLASLPPRHYHTGWVLAALGRAHFELAEYEQAMLHFQQVRQLEPHRLQGMDCYSTALWHLQQEVALSALAQELTDFDKEAPETWCAAGNCFSLQKEHETAIKFLQRAIQVDSEFAYAYTLLGHEHMLSEEMDRAMACFRNAIRIDPRHYNAWYGVGMIYYKQEKLQLAEVHFKRALSINPQSSVLMCHIGVVQHALKRTETSLATLNKAITMDPKNPLCKFHRASVYFSLDRHQEALRELEELQQIVPKESLVYFLIGKVHKKLGNTHLALMNFSWAMDLDPKGANNQIKEAIDKRYTTDEEEPIANHEPSSTDDIASISSGPVDHESSHDSSLVDADDMQLQAVESDESF